MPLSLLLVPEGSGKASGPLAGHETIAVEHLAEAIGFRPTMDDVG